MHQAIWKYKKVAGYLFILPAAIYLVAGCFYPLFSALKMSFYKSVATREVFAGLWHYGNLLRDHVFWSVTGHTFFFAGFSVLFHFLIGLGFALLLNRNLKYKNVWMGLQFIPWLFPMTVVACLWVLIYQPQLGILNNLLRRLNLSTLAIEWLNIPETALAAVTVANIWSFYPFFTLILLAAMQNIPLSVYEASTIDGAGAWSRFWYITIPLIRPAIFTSCLLDMIWTFRFFDLVWIMTKGGPARYSEILPTYVYKTAFYNFDFHRAAAIGGLMVIFMVSFCTLYLVFYSKSSK